MRAIVTEEQRRSRAKGGSPFGAGRFCEASGVARQLHIPDMRHPRSLSPHKIARSECSLNQGPVSNYFPFLIGTAAFLKNRLPPARASISIPSPSWKSPASSFLAKGSTISF
jgi:hypothetical protein